MSKILIAIILIIVIAVVSYLALSVWRGCQGPDTGIPDMPDIEKATHSVYIENTSGLILTSDYEVYGSEVGSRIFILHGFYEMRGKGFKFVEGDIILDEGIFGEITVKRR